MPKKNNDSSDDSVTIPTQKDTVMTKQENIYELECNHCREKIMVTEGNKMGLRHSVCGVGRLLPVGDVPLFCSQCGAKGKPNDKKIVRCTNIGDKKKPKCVNVNNDGSFFVGSKETTIMPM